MDAKNRKNMELMNEMAELLILHKNAFDAIKILNDEIQTLYKQFNDLQEYLKQKEANNEAEIESGPSKQSVPDIEDASGTGNDAYDCPKYCALIMMIVIFAITAVIAINLGCIKINDNYNGILMENWNLLNKIHELEILHRINVNYEKMYSKGKDKEDELIWEIETMNECKDTLLIEFENMLINVYEKELNMEQHMMKLRNDSCMKEKYIEKMEEIIHHGLHYIIFKVNLSIFMVDSAHVQ